MSIDNKAATTRLTWMILSAVIMILSSLLLGILFRVKDIIGYIIIGSCLIALIFKLLTMKYFKLEISEDLISVKYNHPLVNRYKSVDLELSWYKISFYQLEKSTFFHYIYIGVYGRSKDKIFHYNLRIMSKRVLYKLTKV